MTEAVLRGATTPNRISPEEIAAVVNRFTSIVAVIRKADPADKAQIYQGLNLTLT